MKLFLLLILPITYCGCISAQIIDRNEDQFSSPALAASINKKINSDESDLVKICYRNDFKELANFNRTRRSDSTTLPMVGKVYDDAKNTIEAKSDFSVKFNKRLSFKPFPSLFPATLSPTNEGSESNKSATAVNSPKKDEKFQWLPALKQSLLFLSIQHSYAFTQPKTRRSIKGKFFKDYFNSVKSLHGWDDGGRFFTNYVAHPMEGSFLGFVQIQNDPKGIKQRFGSSGDYWRSRGKAFLWSAAWSTQFEIGPVSQASIGNVGLQGKQTWVDIVITPTVGTAMLITEDAIDRFLIERIERKTKSFYVRIIVRILLNPTRTAANLIRFKEPWYRDRKVATN